jgi:Met-zincin/Domain of unknown function (DUF5117)/Domain of unknown function (DUF5118)
MTAKLPWSVLVAMGLVGFLSALRGAGAQQATVQAEKPAEKKEGPGESAEPTKSEKIKPYDKVITKDAKTSAGLFLVHRLEEKAFYEIPTEELGKPMLWVTQLSKTQSGHGYAGSPISDRVVRWELREDTVLLREVRYLIRADVEDPIKNAVEASSVEPILAAFQVAAYGKDKRPVIDVTSLFNTDIPEFSARRQVSGGGSGIDPKRTFVEKIKAFPRNIETRVLVTYRPGSAAGGMGPSGPPAPSPGEPTQSGVTVELHHSMVKLPDALMRPRRFDDRVGFFRVTFEDYGTPKQEVEKVSYINRWRLEKKDPKAQTSEPKQPIVFYIGREVPAKWRPWVMKGIEAWQPSFEKAGFLKAIIGKEPPSEREDPDWDAEDARYSSIRWLPATIENAFGPHVHDPRTGEILEADIRIFHNVLKLIRDWYFVQASPNDKRAQKLPLPDDLMGEILAYVVSHEVGHSLGFPHNMKASSSYTIEQLRSAEFTKKYGVEASIMDYGRFNYVAQPGDNSRLIPIIGPYDEFATEWGYREFPDAKTYVQEKTQLDQIVTRQKTDRKLLFGNPNPAQDPSQQTEDLGADSLRATEQGLKNIDRVAGFLVPATAKEGENYDLLRNMYTELVNQRNRELGHVVNVVGGFVETNFWYPDGKKVYDPVSGQNQHDAVKFLIEHAFQIPTALTKPDILDRLEAHGAADRILESQRSILARLIDESRLKRMSELAARQPEGAYRPEQLMSDLHEGIWSELDKASPAIDLYRRNLQRLFVDRLAAEVRTATANSDLPALARGELERILGKIKGVESAHSNLEPIVKFHLEDLRARIDRAFSPYPIPTGAPVSPATPFPPRGSSD